MKLKESLKDFKKGLDKEISKMGKSKFSTQRSRAVKDVIYYGKVSKKERKRRKLLENALQI